MKFVELRYEQACQHLAVLVGDVRVDYSLGINDINDFIRGGQTFAVEVENAQVGVFTVRKMQRAKGKELEVLAGLQLSSTIDLTMDVLPRIEYMFAHDCDVVTVYTARRGLGKKLNKSGYQNVAQIWKKRVA